MVYDTTWINKGAGMNITYRNYIDKDIDAIIAFWNINSGWETTMNRAEFKQRFQSSPAGDSIMMLAIDEEAEELVGLFCFIPLMITIKNITVKGYRPFGAVLKESFRQQFGLASFLTRKHPILQLYYKGTDVAFQNGADVMYMLPDPRWGRILKIFPFMLHKFPLWSYRLPLARGFEAESQIRTEVLEPTDSSIDLLWANSANMNRCTLTRNSAFYQWRHAISHGAFSLRGVYAAENLIGLFTLYYSDTDAQWLINDVVTTSGTQTLTQTLKAACRSAHVAYTAKKQKPGKNYKIALLATPLLEQEVKQLGFYKDDYEFTLAVHLLNQKRFSKTDVAPRYWHLSAKD